MALNLARAGGYLTVAVSLHGEYPKQGEMTGNYDVDYFVQMAGDNDPLIPPEARDAWIGELTNHTYDSEMNYDMQIWGDSLHGFAIKYSETLYTFLAQAYGSVAIPFGTAGIMQWDSERE